MSGTNLGRMPILIVSLVIGIVMATTAIVPLVSDYSDAKTFINEGYNRYTSIDSTDEGTVNISWDHTDPHVITVNDVDIPLTIMSGYTSIIFGQDFTFRCINTSSYANIQFIGPTNAVFLEVKSTLTDDMTVTATGGNLSVTVGSTTKTATYSTLYYPDVEGEYIMKDPNTPAYVFGDSSVIVANGITTVNNSGMGVYFSGNIDDGYTFNFYRDTSAVESNVNTDYDEVDGYIDLLSLNKITFTITDGESTVDATYSYFLVPYEVTADPDNPAAYMALVKVVPVMAFVALIAAAAYMIYSKRD